MSTKKLLACALALSASFANATLSSVDLAPGDGALTLDSATNLTWLDLPKTSGLSFDQVRQSEWITKGFRFATLDEVRTLFAHAGISFNYEPGQPLQASAGIGADAQRLAEQLGVAIPQNSPVSNLKLPLDGSYIRTLPLSGLVGTDSNNDTVTEENHPLGTGFRVVEISLASTQAFGGPDPFYMAVVHGKDVRSSSIGNGSFLVKSASPVPEPSSMFLMILGLAGIGATRRFNRS